MMLSHISRYNAGATPVEIMETIGIIDKTKIMKDNDIRDLLFLILHKNDLRFPGLSTYWS